MAYQGIRVEIRRSILSGLSIVCTLAFLSFVWTDRDILVGLRVAAEHNDTLKDQLVFAGQLEVDERVKQQRDQRVELLVILSLILCTVGISNAMAMSVTERFQQIGTMKCLGSLDSFIVRIFFLEAMFLGLAGTLAGNLIGVILAVSQESLSYGVTVIPAMSFMSLLENGARTVLIGVGITLVGALYPAFVAARMQPVEAMRVTT
jgi:ABC-type antimicrobial peptide transport system permease subunit